MEANVEAEPVTPNRRMGGWCLFRIRADACLGSCACGAVGIMGMKRRPGADRKEGLHGAGGTGKRFEPGAGKAFQVRK